jgi:hypothetical protein
LTHPILDFEFFAVTRTTAREATNIYGYTNYFSGTSEETLNDLLLFWTSHPSLPLGNSKLVVKCLECIPKKLLPEANTCPMVLSIPTVLTSYEEFRNMMDKAVGYAKSGFGKESHIVFNYQKVI